MKTDQIKSCKCMDLSQLPCEAKEQLAILNNSQNLITQIIAGILVQYKTLDIQKEQLVCGTLCPEEFNPDCYPDTLKMQIASSLIILGALFGFYNQSQCLLEEACESGTATKGQKLELTLSEIVILVALIRVFRLAKTEKATEKAVSQETTNEETTEEATETKNEESPLLTTEELDNLEPDF